MCGCVRELGLFVERAGVDFVLVCFQSLILVSRFYSLLYIFTRKSNENEIKRVSEHTWPWGIFHLLSPPSLFLSSGF